MLIVRNGEVRDIMFQANSKRATFVAGFSMLVASFLVVGLLYGFSGRTAVASLVLGVIAAVVSLISPGHRSETMELDVDESEAAFLVAGSGHLGVHDVKPGEKGPQEMNLEELEQPGEPDQSEASDQPEESESDSAIQAAARAAVDVGRSIKLVGELAEYNGKLNARLDGVTQNVMSIAERTTNLRGLIEGQTAGVNEISASVEEMAGTVRNVHTSAENAEDAGTSMQDAISRSGEVIRTTAGHMDRVLSAIGIVRKFTETIVDIAERTNLLAINASIEAAHSGHDGSGFAVIAGEIRKLAENSNEHAAEAEQALSGVVTDIERTSGYLEETKSIFEELRSGADRVANVVQEIRGAMTEQEVGTSEIVAAVHQLSESSSEVQSDYGTVDEAIDEVQFSFIEISSLAKNTQGAAQKLSALLSRVEQALDQSADTHSVSA